MRTPDFDQILKVLRREEPDRPTIFEFSINDELMADASGKAPDYLDFAGRAVSFARLGYDYATVGFGKFFEIKTPERQASYSANDTVTIPDRAAFESYRWPDPDSLPYHWLDEAAEKLTGNQKLIPVGPGGVLENLLALMGFDNLCFALADDPELVKNIADEVGSRLLRYYQRVVEYKAVGACFVNDDWGFCSQPMLPPGAMRELIVPWHRRMTECIHEAGMPAILHSCGNLKLLMDDIIDDCKFDGKHSFEDKIQPVEEAYEEFHSRIAIMGGIDLDFLCRAAPEAVYRRSAAMMERVKGRGGFALGSGNSIPAYVPAANYRAMSRAALA